MFHVPNEISGVIHLHAPSYAVIYNPIARHFLRLADATYTDVSPLAVCTNATAQHAGGGDAPCAGRSPTRLNLWCEISAPMFAIFEIGATIDDINTASSALIRDSFWVFPGCRAQVDAGASQIRSGADASRTAGRGDFFLAEVASILVGKGFTPS